MPRIKKFTAEQRLNAINEYNKKYKAKNYKALTIQLNANKYKDVLTKLENVPNKTDYIVSLVRKDIIENGIE